MSNTNSIVTRDFCVRSGNTGTTENENGIVLTVTDASSFTFHLKTAAFGSGAIAKTSPGDITVSGDTVTIPFSLTDNAAFAAEGQAVAYEIERRTATTSRSLMAGNITGIVGLTDD